MAPNHHLILERPVERLARRRRQVHGGRRIYRCCLAQQPLLDSEPIRLGRHGLPRHAGTGQLSNLFLYKLIPAENAVDSVAHQKEQPVHTVESRWEYGSSAKIIPDDATN